jgi:hypothetical protein
VQGHVGWVHVGRLRRPAGVCRPVHRVGGDASAGAWRSGNGFGLDNEFACYYLSHFISNSDTNTNIIVYKFKTDISNSDSHSNTYSIYSVES